jgi:hypothetical protein
MIAAINMKRTMIMFWLIFSESAFYFTEMISILYGGKPIIAYLVLGLIAMGYLYKL